MIEAVRRFGVFKGFYLGVKRLGRCQPMCEGGFDPVPEIKANHADIQTDQNPSNSLSENEKK